MKNKDFIDRLAKNPKNLALAAIITIIALDLAAWILKAILIR